MNRNPYFNYVGTAFSETLSGAINQAAHSSAEVREILNHLEGKSIRFGLTDFNYEFVLSVEGNTVFIDTDRDEPEDLQVRTTIANLLKIATTSNLNPAKLEGVEIVGDVQLVQYLYSAFREIQFDWEEELSKRVGDIPARHLGNVVRWGGSKASTLRSALFDKTRTTLVDEQYLVPERSRVQTFIDEVDSVVADVDRLEKRVDRLKRREKQ